MPSSTTYVITRGGKLQYAFYAIFLGGSGIYILSAFFTEGTKAHEQGWPVYVFAGIVISLWLAYAGYCALRAFKTTPRITVDSRGFLYEGIFKNLRFEWKNITAIKQVHSPRYNDKWLKITIKTETNETRRVRLDFSGLSPSKVDFIAQASSLAPWIMI